MPSPVQGFVEVSLERESILEVGETCLGGANAPAEAFDQHGEARVVIETFMMMTIEEVEF